MPPVVVRIRFITTVHATTVDIAALECYNTRKEAEGMNKKAVGYIVFVVIVAIALFVVALICMQASSDLSSMANELTGGSHYWTTVSEEDQQQAEHYLSLARWLTAGGLLAFLAILGLGVSAYWVYGFSKLANKEHLKQELKNRIDEYQQQLDNLEKE